MSDSTRPRAHDSAEPPVMMTNASVVVSTGSRLHFGLLNTVDPFGGAGVMVDAPVTLVKVRPADCFSCDPQTRDRILPIVRRMRELAGWKQLPECSVSIFRHPPKHCGLGSGTQLAMAIAEAIGRFTEFQMEPFQMASEVALRGKRSAVGIHGYLRGGLIFEDADKSCTVNPLRQRIDMPSRWCVAIFRPAGSQIGISGGVEFAHFAKLPQADATTTHHLRRIVAEQILPAAEDGDFDRFADSLQDYNAKSGLLFAPVQGGRYNGPEVTGLIEQLTARGARGVGQSSWGPGVFAWFESRPKAEAFCNDLGPGISVIALTHVRNHPRVMTVRGISR